jgi:hypothetical protein
MEALIKEALIDVLAVIPAEAGIQVFDNHGCPPSRA